MSVIDDLVTKLRSFNVPEEVIRKIIREARKEKDEKIAELIQLLSLLNNEITAVANLLENFGMDTNLSQKMMQTSVSSELQKITEEPKRSKEKGD